MAKSGVLPGATASDTNKFSTTLPRGLIQELYDEAVKFGVGRNRLIQAAWLVFNGLEDDVKRRLLAEHTQGRTYDNRRSLAHKKGKR